MDWELPASLRPYVTARKWTIPGARSMSITAAFWKNKCVWIDVNYDNRHGNKSAISPENCEELVKYFLPGVRFGAFRGNPKTELMEYSTRPARAYKLRKWHRNDFHYVEIFDMNSIRSLIAQDIAAQKKDASSLTKAIYSLPNAENAPLFGANRSDIKRMLGEPVECSFEIPNKHDVYGIPGCNMKLLILFDNNVCKEINIVYDGGVLAADAGLQVAQALLGKTPLPKMTDQQKKSWFLVKSVDEKARYSIEWYLGENWGVLMKLKDSQVSPQKSEKVQSLLDSL